MEKNKFEIKGMSCAACVANVEKAVAKLPGVEKAEVSLLANNMKAEYDAEKISAAEIISAVEKAGYEAFIEEKKDSKEKSEKKSRQAGLENEIKEMKRRVIISFVLSLTSNLIFEVL